MLPFSASYWYIFELYNLLIQNWLYINTSPEKWIAVTMKLLSFATVLPALYETADLLRFLSKEKKVHTNRAWIPENWDISSPALPSLAVILSLLPLLFPKLLFWAVWLGPFLLMDSINHRLGRSSILRDWQAGDLRRTIIFLIAGYICGFLWEFWNYWAYTKWIYTVPIPDMPHIFEMPILGFLGFGPFGLETFAFWTLVWGEKRKSEETL